MVSNINDDNDSSPNLEVHDHFCSHD